MLNGYMFTPLLCSATKAVFLTCSQKQIFKSIATEYLKRQKARDFSHGDSAGSSHFLLAGGSQATILSHSPVAHSARWSLADQHAPHAVGTHEQCI